MQKSREDMETEFHWHCWATHKEVVEEGGGRENGPQLITYPQVKEEEEKRNEFLNSVLPGQPNNKKSRSMFPW
jgi:hypothetical protein